MEKLNYAAPVRPRESRFALVAFVIGLTSGPAAFYFGDSLGALLPRSQRYRHETIGILAWLAASIAVSTVCLICSRTPLARLRSFAGIVTTIAWAALYLLVAWWVSHWSFAPAG